MIYLQIETKLITKTNFKTPTNNLIGNLLIIADFILRTLQNTLADQLCTYKPISSESTSEPNMDITAFQ